MIPVLLIGAFALVLKSFPVQIHYQPQYDYEGKCIGVESLLRWNHPTFGMMYPPLIIKLAEEGGFLLELEEAIMQRVLGETGYQAGRLAGS